MVRRGEAHVRSIYVKTIAASLNVRGQIDGSIGSVGLSHASLPFVKILPGVSAGGGDISAGHFTGADLEGVPRPGIPL